MSKKILIQTALSLEFQEVEKYLQNTAVIRHPETGSIYKKGMYDAYEILLVETGAGNIRASDETGRAISFFQPDYVFFVGVAGGVKDVGLADVVASSKVIGYEMGKDEDEFKPRFDTMPASYVLEQLAKHVKRQNVWIKRLNEPGDRLPEAFVQPIAAGEKVVASTRSVTYKYLKQFCSDAVAVDMEGNGFLVAARPYHTHAIEVRGISDLIDKKSEADATGSQPLAARNAAAFCFEMIDQLEPVTNQLPDTTTLAFRKQFVGELVKLYPQGPEQNDIWKRAGGDVSMLSNASSRKSQWFGAIEALSLGGGGKAITVKSLLDEIVLDYPNWISVFIAK
ncbi:5'-methylthioadenosine/S-adenosylhomocysteine nucleosidase [Asinibacterium sp. OR53]|uniref:5'-methylthioadenosine/S-adenosylhomocysteine nucleosidase family protein n=1 Tax=Asinibacterium sp. OR53 TaxID=925409 RepID=UPI0004B5C49A|nr:5'-methylthioadenosine/S-adenosylhomocysteine nucleosidase [Asinibacterium sp. OR53]